MTKVFLRNLLLENRRIFKKKLVRLLNSLDKRNFVVELKRIIPKIEELGVLHSFKISIYTYRDRIFMYNYIK